MKVRLYAYGLVSSVMLTGCLTNFEMEVCSEQACAVNTEVPIIQVNGLAGSLTLGLSVNDEIVEQQNTDGDDVSFDTGVTGDDKASVVVISKPDGQVCLVENDGVLSEAVLTGKDSSEITVSCSDASKLALVGFNISGDVTLRIGGAETFVVTKGATDIEIETAGDYDYSASFEVVSHPAGHYCKINRLSDDVLLKDQSRIPVELFCFEKGVSFKEISASHFGFTLLRDDDMAVSFGLNNIDDPRYNHSYDISGIRADLFSIESLNSPTMNGSLGFAATTKSGSVVTWGYNPNGTHFGADSSSVRNLLVDVTSVYSNSTSMLAKTTTGKIIGWGYLDGFDAEYGNEIKSISSDPLSFAIVKNNGDVDFIGHVDFSWVDAMASFTLDDIEDIDRLFGFTDGYIGLKNNGDVIILSQSYLPDRDREGEDDKFYQLIDRLKGVKEVVSCGYGHAVALKGSGDIVSWSAYDDRWTNTRSGLFMDDWANGQDNVSAVVCGQSAFAAIRHDGTSFSWGDEFWGGDSSVVEGQLTGVIKIHPLDGGFIAQKSNGEFVYWGAAVNPAGESIDHGVIPQLTGATGLVVNAQAAAGIKPDGSVVTWGMDSSGADVSSVEAELYDIGSLYATREAFGALRVKDHAFVTWGNPAYGGDSSKFKEELNRF